VRPYLKNNYKQKRAGCMAQVVARTGPEFKLQYCQRRKKRRRMVLVILGCKEKQM
jgi:hypothetical protein